MELEKYPYLADLHTHTIASGHAKNTIEEMVESAIKKGIKLFGITEHAVTMPGTCDEKYFRNILARKKDFEERTDDIEVLFGVELNILDFDGNVDMSEEDLKLMDINIASIHNMIGYESGTVEQNTNALINAMKNPLINIIGHPDDGRVPLDYEKVAKAAKEFDTLLEINNNSISSGFRLNAYDNERKLLEYCKKYEVPVIISSDAHDIENVANNSKAFELLKKIDFDYNLVLNFNIDKLKKYLNKYRNKE